MFEIRNFHYLCRCVGDDSITFYLAYIIEYSLKSLLCDTDTLTRRLDGKSIKWQNLLTMC